MGGGSPNTVGPMLDVWFKHLGSRLGDAPALPPPSIAADVPLPVITAAKLVWDSSAAKRPL